MNATIQKRWIILLFLLPSLVGLLVFSIIPIFYSFLISFTDWNGLNKWNLAEGIPLFIGVQHYIEILSTSEFWKVLGNTLTFIVLYIPLILIVSTLAAVLLNQKRKGVGFFRVVYFVPVLTSWVAASLIWKWLLSKDYGPINQLLSFIGIEGPAWLQDPLWAMPGIVLASVWKDLGYFSLIILGGLQGINPSYYEASEIDGANAVQRLTKITIPLLTPILFFVIIISIISSFQLFPQVMIMTDAGPYGSTQVMVERIYRYSFNYYKMGYASAFSWLLFIIIFIFTMVQLKLQKKWVHYDG